MVHMWRYNGQRIWLKTSFNHADIIKWMTGCETWLGWNFLHKIPNDVNWKPMRLEWIFYLFYFIFLCPHQTWFLGEPLQCVESTLFYIRPILHIISWVTSKTPTTNPNGRNLKHKRNEILANFRSFPSTWGCCFPIWHVSWCTIEV